MIIVVAPQAFKGSLSSKEAASAMADGAQSVFPQAKIVKVPVADGGDGTLETLIDATDGEFFSATVSGPLSEPVSALWGETGDKRTAVIETARACGLVLLPENKRDPRFTTTYGAGELIKEALDLGYRRFILGIGGSSTNDGGAGLAQALGARLINTSGESLPRGGSALLSLAHIDLSDLHPAVHASKFLIANDVTNPLIGPQGAAAVYGPQKGATPDMVALLDQALEHLAKVIYQDLGREIKDIPGSGAAGGMGGGLLAFLGGKFFGGADLVLDSIDLNATLATADLVLIGEGRLDASTSFNKAPLVVAQRARKLGIRVVAIAGSLGLGYESLHEEGIEIIMQSQPPNMALEQAMTEAAPLLKKATEKALHQLTL